MEWHLADRVYSFGPGSPALILGIVNVTPDSFSDGGRYLDEDAAVAHGLRLVQEGADLLDIGGESTRPGATPVSVDDELQRVLPVVVRLAQATPIPLSIDTSKPAVARACLTVGAKVINDVTALADPEMVEVARTSGAGIILMHMQGNPRTMQLDPRYDDVVQDIRQFLEARLHDLEQLGIAGQRVALDPGFGFGKTFDHNLELLARLGELRQAGRPICFGVSRKGFLGQITGRPRDQRTVGSVALACDAMSQGAAHILRVHDVRETRDAVQLLAAITERRARGPSKTGEQGGRIIERPAGPAL